MFQASALVGMSYQGSVNWEESRTIWSLWVQQKAAIQREFNLGSTVNVTAASVVRWFCLLP
jgi:hypothetical protein